MSSKIDCLPAQGVSAAPWPADLNGNSWTSCLAPEDAVFENTLSLAWKQHKTEKQRSNVRRCPQQHPESWLSSRKSFLFEASMAMIKDRQTQQQKAATSKEVSETRALWRAGNMTKLEYVKFRNQIHLLELQASKGDMDGEEARRARQTLLADLVGSGRKGAARKIPEWRTRARTRRCRGAFRRPSVPGPRPSKFPRPARRRQYDCRITPGSVKMRKRSTINFPYWKFPCYFS